MIKRIIFASFLVLTGSVQAQQFETVNTKIPSGIQVERLRGELGAASVAGSVRSMIPIAVDLLKEFEGYRNRPYNDAVGYCTIGYGHLIALERCEELDLSKYAIGITKSEGEALLLEDTKIARRAVSQLTNTNLTDAEFGALASFVYNLGAGNYQKSTLRRKLNRGDHANAASEFPRWVRAGGKVLRGLQIRRACEQGLFLEEIPNIPGGPFNRRVCEALGAATFGAPLIDIFEGG